MKAFAVACFLLLLAGVLVHPFAQPAGRAPDERCACGPLDFALADEFAIAANCECPDCRAATAAAFRLLSDAIARISGRVLLRSTER